MRKINIAKQKGYILVIAVIFIMVIGLMAVVINYIFSSRAALSSAQYNGLRVFYLAESGLDITTHYLSRLSLTSAPARISCASVTGTGELTNSSLLNGTFTATTINSSPIYVNNSLSASITSSATSMTLSSSSGFAPNGRVVIDGESIDYAGVSGNSLTNLTRGVAGTTAASHASGAGVGQYQCSLDVQAGIPSIASPSYKANLQWNVQLQDGWVGENASGSNYTLLQWNRPTELSFTNSSIAGGSSAANVKGISMLSNADGWAVTAIASGNVSFLHWNGSSWSATTAAACSSQDMLGVSMVSSQEGWAVGSRYRVGCAGGANFRYSVAKWDGSNWTFLTPATTPNVPADGTSSTINTLNAVSMVDTNGDGLGNVGFAVGDGGTILQSSGGNWTSISSPTTKNLFGVVVVSASEAWAAGQAGTLIKWNGSSWSTVSLSTTNNLNAIAMLDSDGDGLANFGVVVGNSGQIILYNGSTWSESTVGTTNFLGVAIYHSEDAWAVGASGTAIHWDGSAWTSISTGVTRQLNAISLVGAKSFPNSLWRQSFH